MKVFSAQTVQEAVYTELTSLLRNGGVVAYPTDTAYGLGADALNEQAVARIFRIKGRPETRPLLLLVDSVPTVESVAMPSPIFYRTADAFWPGPLTLIVKAGPSLPLNVTAGTGTIGVRWPAASFATTLVKRYGRPLTATSANRSGMPSAVSAGDVRRQLGESIDALVDGGVLSVPGGSTLLDLTVSPPVLLREGPVTFDALSKFFQGNIRRRAA